MSRDGQYRGAAADGKITLGDAPIEKMEYGFLVSALGGPCAT